MSLIHSDLFIESKQGKGELEAMVLGITGYKMNIEQPTVTRKANK